MPTGGVSPDVENLTNWFKAGAYCVGMGSKLMLKDAKGNFEVKKIEALTASTLKNINTIRKA